MKCKNFILYSIFIFSFFVSCIDMSNELDDLNYKPSIVIEGLVLDLEGKSYINLSMSAPDGDSLNSYPINDANVRIIEDNMNVYPFKLSSKGIYANPDFVGKINSSYTLKVEYEGSTYTATSVIMPITHIDSLTYFVTDSISKDSCEYKIFVYAERAAQDFTSYYKIKLYNNDSLYNAYSDLLLIDDQVFDSFRKLELPHRFHSHDTLRFDLYSLTRDVYYYYTELSDLTNGNLNSIYFYPQNPVSNISKGELGIFQTSAVSSKEIILP
jgi:hypothetical protein